MYIHIRIGTGGKGKIQDSVVSLLTMARVPSYDYITALSYSRRTHSPRKINTRITCGNRDLVASHTHAPSRMHTHIPSASHYLSSTSTVGSIHEVRALPNFAYTTSTTDA